MKQMVMLVLNNPDHSMILLEAWEAAGASGITILESTGLVRMRQAGVRDDLPLMPTLLNMLRSKEMHHRTIFSVVDDEDQAQTLIEATTWAFEQMDQTELDNSGVLFVLPVTDIRRFATRKAANKETGNQL